MLAFLDPSTNAYLPWSGQAVNDVYYPLSIDGDPNWTVQDLNTAGFYPVNLFQAPDGQQISGPASYALDADGQHVDQSYPTTAASPATIYVNAADDSDAASQGVPIGTFYRNGSQLMVRVS